jgi:hypothetical protein
MTDPYDLHAERAIIADLEHVDVLKRELADAKRELDNATSDAKQSEVDAIRALHERNEAREQRDRLAQAIRELWNNHTLHGAAYELIEETLSAVEGGGDE